MADYIITGNSIGFEEYANALFQCPTYPKGSFSFDIDDGNYSVVDSNVNGGKTIKYSVENLKNILGGKEGVDVYGKKVGVSYQAQTKDGTIKVLAVSEGLKQKDVIMFILIK